ncbi:hypothetical protein QR680_001509 [Steinernema hermaphroditum]|uniref:Protein quiver n=1 Tax=Steinernema hermaphroditum TaxID=289476 RepID=A0AA39H1F6_9BILA|nr:hypothetical protein QR680_001509 [Steinernema hermaphroditum]
MTTSALLAEEPPASLAWWSCIHEKMTAASGLLLFVVLVLPRIADSISCYHCISQLKLSSEEMSSRTTMRVFLNEVYNVPPAHPLCADSSDLEFSTLPTYNCTKGECIKITMNSGDLNLVIRGCDLKIYKKSVIPQKDLRCDPKTSPSVCSCGSDLCNATPTTRPLLSPSNSFFLSALMNIILCWYLF